LFGRGGGGRDATFMFISPYTNQNESIKQEINRNKDQWHVVWIKSGDIFTIKITTVTGVL